jgi:hypothetical protein
VLRVELLPAADGDAIWIAYGNAKKPHRLVIDGGPASTYANGIRARIAEAASKRSGPVTFDLFVVSHIDADHIDASLILLRDAQIDCEFHDIWFNGWAQIAPADDSPDIFAPLQGEFLTSILGDRAAKLPWNRAVDSKAVGLPDEGRLPVFELAGGMKLTLLSPGAGELKRLRARWQSAIRDFTPGDLEEARRRLEDRRDYQPPDAPPIFGAPVLGDDRTPANGSSIAVLAEYGGCAILLAADAHARVLARNLRRLADEREVPTIALDAFKLPHHGSMRNLTPEVLDQVTCRRFLFSTNGDKHQHPDHETVDLILGRGIEGVELYFNYKSSTTTGYEADAHGHYVTEYGTEGRLKLNLERAR